jgi:hypothetical protein
VNVSSPGSSLGVSVTRHTSYSPANANGERPFVVMK